MIESRQYTSEPRNRPSISVALIAAALGFSALVGAGFAGLQSLFGG